MEQKIFVNPLHTILIALSRLNTVLLAVTRSVALLAMVAMVAAILIQVFFRYVLGNALPWPDEFARFCMLWMTGLMAPVAYRVGGFVAIDLLPSALGRRAAAILTLVLLTLSLLVLVMGVKLGIKHVNSGMLFASSSLRIPLEWFGLETIKLKLAYIYASLWIGLILLTSVNIELMLRAIVQFTGKDPDIIAPFPADAAAETGAN